MLFRTVKLLRVSPFSVFMKDLKKTGELRNMSLANGARVASRMYRNLTPSQMRSLQERASKITYPALKAFNDFQRRECRNLTHMTNAERQRVVGEMWRKSAKRRELQLKKIQAKSRERREERKLRMQDEMKKRLFPTVRKYRIHKVDPADIKRPGFPDITASKKVKGGTMSKKSDRNRGTNKGKGVGTGKVVSMGKSAVRDKIAGTSRSANVSRVINTGRGAIKGKIASVRKAPSMSESMSKSKGKLTSPSKGAPVNLMKVRGRVPAAGKPGLKEVTNERRATRGSQTVRDVIIGRDAKRRLAVSRGVKNLKKNKESRKPPVRRR
ncbi:kinetoplast-associated protein 3, putative [Trypanosoma equiperdum]|uniref:Kinetoplast DNA-associated protein, putative n=4 Tax=Trypanozoon TaxID=39700 RepID=Q381E6_TRYB2|nr:kinetoplast DNA-associated protein, putative [Trypanosoma brucei gambiense DAL972]XP_829697.1 kinetoplast DNA-associated protein, putative [Trypanosoma brucei brucei TREU927]RHW68462.1 kinetoplast-associated protein 3 [Trypanosoma brucei equiperdum]SCU67339.1 kinetoplast-associated protein 3, putative [Trypanosoma equiperdum]EAN80585.1 kinetoplast DNA-associated protein, putative [Trypanosoma brucei brucei TREU927]CBH18724.1 kinetoplast DNA-associated protein, putative [Trypanosoma brucei g|eukprot:XP_011780988.1 kinetoplast DNA-associated protein, putative [Trypanosoma brucei gambiense DAL972]